MLPVVFGVALLLLSVCAQISSHVLDDDDGGSALLMRLPSAVVAAPVPVEVMLNGMSHAPCIVARAVVAHGESL